MDETSEYQRGYEDGIQRGRRVVEDPDKFPVRQPDYTMRTATGHEPLPKHEPAPAAGARPTVEQLEAQVEQLETGIRTMVSAHLSETARLREALEFYADPDSYFAVGFWFDQPCGRFAEDFDNAAFDEYGRDMPGMTARAALYGGPAPSDEAEPESVGSYYCSVCQHPHGYHDTTRGCTMPLNKNGSPLGRREEFGRTCGCKGEGG